jgi:hypothetical protein
VNDGVVAVEGLGQGVDVGQVSLYEVGAGIDRFDVPAQEVVYDGDLMAGVEQLPADVGAYEAGATGDEHLHGSMRLSL